MNTWCLCLDKRKELISQLEEQVNRLLGLTLNKFWCGDGKDSDIPYDKIDIEIDPSQYMNAPGRNHYNAFLSHKKLFREASKNGETILFLEDDAYIIESRISTLYIWGGGKRNIPEIVQIVMNMKRVG